MGMDITFFERTFKNENKYVGELRGYDIADIIFGDTTELCGRELPTIKYSNIEINQDDPGYDTYWLNKETVENYKTILSIMKEVHDDNDIQFEKLIKSLINIFESNHNAKVYLDLSF